MYTEKCVRMEFFICTLKPISADIRVLLEAATRNRLVELTTQEMSSTLGD